MANFFFFGFVLIFTVTVVLSNKTQTFDPRLQWICQTSSISLTLKTNIPFNGIIHSNGNQSDCAVAGNGTMLTNMIIPFGGENDTCGVEFNTVSGTYWVEIEVHSNNTVETEFDRIFNVTCDNTIDQPKAEYILDLYPIPSNDNQRSTNIEHGKTYFLDAFMPSFDDETKYGNNFRITNCIIETVDDTNAIEIINSNGCSSDPKLISEIDYSNGYATTNISSINPYLKMLKLNCKFSICEKIENCWPNCESNWNDSTVKGGNILSATNHFITKKCRTVNLHFFTFDQCFVTDEMFWIYVVIAFGWLLLIISLFWNIYFCCQKCNSPKKGLIDLNSGDSWYHTTLTPSKNDNPEVIENGYHPSFKNVLRRVSTRRTFNEDEIYATIKSRSSTRPIKMAPLSHLFKEHPDTSTFGKASSLGFNHRQSSSSDEEQPYYTSKKFTSKTYF